jgi:O-antigen/teichoic acid export membrane protein
MKTSEITGTVARNSFWYGLDVGLTFAMSFWTSIAIARMIGPERLGYFSYVSWLTNITSVVGCAGIPFTARKYMAEFLGRGEAGIAGAIFFATLKIQILVACCCSAVGLLLVLTLSNPVYTTISALLVLSMVPRMIVYLPSEANAAAENMAGNTPASLVSGLLQVICVILSLHYRWGLLGISAGYLVAYSVELVLKLRNVLTWIDRRPHAPLPRELKKRMLSFSGQGAGLLLVNLIVWDRSDIIFLKAFNSDPRQITFFSLAFNLTEKLMMMPNVMAAGIGISLMTQYGRDRERLNRFVPAAAEYMLLCGLPLMLGAAAVAPAAIRLVYGPAYLPAIPVFIIAALFAIPKVLLSPAQRLLQAGERQAQIVWVTCIFAGVNVLLDYLLVGRAGAVGAAIANGSAQLLTAAGLWILCGRFFNLQWRRPFLVKVIASASLMAVTAASIAWALRTWYGLLLAVVAGACVFLALLRWTRTLAQEDFQRLLQLQRILPSAVSPWFVRGMAVLAPSAIPEPEPVAILD